MRQNKIRCLILALKSTIPPIIKGMNFFNDKNTKLPTGKTHLKSN